MAGGVVMVVVAYFWGAPALLDRFDLATQPPFRIVVGSEGHRLAVACHHAAFDTETGAFHLLLGDTGPAVVGSGAPRGTRSRSG